MRSQQANNLGGRRRRGWLFILPFVALWLVPMALFILLVPLASAAESTSVAPQSPTTIIVGSRTESFLTAVDVTFKLGSTSTVRSTATGVVTSIPVSTGSKIISGTVLATVNNVPIVALAAKAPLYRDVGVGDAGSDVREVNAFLQSRRLLASTAATTTFGYRSKLATKQFQRSIGVPPDGVFRTSYVAFIPAGVDQVGDMSTHVGDTVGGSWTIFSGTPAISAVQITPTTDGASLAPLKGETLEFTAGSQSLQLESLAPSSTEAVTLLKALEIAGTSGAVTATSPNDSSRTYSGGGVRRRSAKTVGVIPTTAVLAAGGTFCVFRSAGSHYSAVALPTIKAADGEIGEAVVSSQLVGAHVVRNASALPSSIRATCKSK